MEKQYFLTVNTWTSNSLCELVSNLVRDKFNHTLLKAEDWRKLRDFIVDAIDTAKEDCPRCRQPKMIDVELDADNDHRDLHSITLYKSEHDDNPAFVLIATLVRESPIINGL